MIRLLVIEDNASIIVAGLRNLFRPERDGIRVEIVAGSAAEAVRKAASPGFDLILLDLWLSNALPMDNFRMLKQAFPGKPVIIYTQDDSPVWRNKMMRAGAGAYIVKNTPRDEFKLAITKVARGSVWHSGPPAADDQPEAMSERHLVQITPVQRRMAEMLAHGSDRRQIAEALGIHPSAVDKSFAKMRQDFNCKNNYELIRVLTDNSIV